MTKKIFNVVKWLVYAIQFMCSIAFVYLLYSIELVPMNYIIILGVVLGLLFIGEYFLIFCKKPKNKRSVITQLLSLVLSGILIVGCFYVYKMGQVVDLLGSESFQTRAISVIVLKESEIRNERSLPHHKLGYISSIDKETMSYATKKIQKNVEDITLSDYTDFSKMINALYSKKVDGIILDEAFRTLVDQQKKTFEKDTRVIYQVTQKGNAVSSKSVDVTKKPFLVYISGNDEYGAISAVSRSDVNVLAAVNPVTHQVLLLSIPRDTYYPLHRNGQMDKFTHAGIYGLQESINTLQDILKEDINYYGKMNFTSFMNIIDAIGGITVYSPESFVTKIGHYQIHKGENKLNAKQALGFVRERKSFSDGDFARGRNQQRMISAVVKKLCSPAILTSFSSVLDTISKSVETNFSTAEINALVQMQLSDMPSWDIQSYQIEGIPMRKPCYSSGGINASVVVPNQESIDQARKYIGDLMAYKIIKTKDGNLNENKRDHN